jgi:hypothetical protein
MKNLLTREQAKALARDYIRRLNTLPDGDELVICDENTIERPFGWVFFYDSRRALETGDFRHAIAGNAPIIVNRHDGSITVTGTALPVEYYISEYEERLAKHAT